MQDLVAGGGETGTTARKIGWKNVDFLTSVASYALIVAAAKGGATNGLYAGNVDMPFLLLTRGKLDMSLAQVAIVPGAAENAIVRC